MGGEVSHGDCRGRGSSVRAGRGGRGVACGLVVPVIRSALGRTAGGDLAGPHRLRARVTDLVHPDQVAQGDEDSDDRDGDAQPPARCRPVDRRAAIDEPQRHHRDQQDRCEDRHQVPELGMVVARLPDPALQDLTGLLRREAEDGREDSGRGHQPPELGGEPRPERHHDHSQRRERHEDNSGVDDQRVHRDPVDQVERPTGTLSQHPACDCDHRWRLLPISREEVVPAPSEHSPAQPM